MDRQIEGGKGEEGKKGSRKKEKEEQREMETEKEKQIYCLEENLGFLFNITLPCIFRLSQVGERKVEFQLAPGKYT